MGLIYYKNIQTEDLSDINTNEDFASLLGVAEVTGAQYDSTHENG